MEGSWSTGGATPSGITWEKTSVSEEESEKIGTEEPGEPPINLP